MIRRPSSRSLHHEDLFTERIDGRQPMSQLTRDPISPTKPSVAGSEGAKKKIWISAGVIAVAIASLAAWKLRPVKMPPLDADPVVLAKFVSSSDFDRVKEQQKSPYRIALRAKSKELADALKDGRLTKEEYDEAYLNGWLARQQARMRSFFRLPVANRQQVWTEQYVQKNLNDKPNGVPMPAPAVEKAFVARVVGAWPEEEQAMWEDYRSVAKEAKRKLVEQQKK